MRVSVRERERESSIWYKCTLIKLLRVMKYFWYVIFRHCFCTIIFLIAINNNNLYIPGLKRAIYMASCWSCVWVCAYEWYSSELIYYIIFKYSIIYALFNHFLTICKLFKHLLLLLNFQTNWVSRIVLNGIEGCSKSDNQKVLIYIQYFTRLLLHFCRHPGSNTGHNSPKLPYKYDCFYFILYPCASLC